MSYEEALKAAGAEVLEYESFGSYQGDWWAKVRWNGGTGWINGSYGSCSGCDSFEAEFGWNDDQCEEHRYDEKQDGCESCRAAAAEYQRRLADFGRQYLDTIYSQAEAEAEAARNIEWDSDAPAMLAWIKEHAIPA
jgi:hypothetical protein